MHFETWTAISKNGSHGWNKKTPLGIVTLAFGGSMTTASMGELQTSNQKNWIGEWRFFIPLFHIAFYASSAGSLSSLNRRMPTLRFRVAFFYSIHGLLCKQTYGRGCNRHWLWGGRCWQHWRSCWRKQKRKDQQQSINASLAGPSCDDRWHLHGCDFVLFFVIFGVSFLIHSIQKIQKTQDEINSTISLLHFSPIFICKNRES